MSLTKRFEFVTIEKLNELLNYRKHLHSVVGKRGRKAGELNLKLHSMKPNEVVLVRHECNRDSRANVKCRAQAVVSGVSKVTGVRYKTVHIPDGRLAIMRKE